jgi:putative RecB family exonuclease
VPDRISVSQVNAYLMCPRKYRFRYIDKLEPEHRSANMAYGSAVHSAIAWWQKQRIEGNEVSIEDASRILRADWTAQVAAGDLDLSEQCPVEMQEQGEALVRLFVDRFPEEVPDEVDYPVELELSDPRTGEVLPIPLVGYFDYVVGGVVGEIKTTARRSKARSQWNMQLACYSWAERMATGRRPTMRVVQLVKTKKPQIVVDEFVMSEREEDWFREVACEVYRGVQAEAFFPNPGWVCPGCEYRGACRIS